MFKEYDADKSGYLDAKELRNAFRALGNYRTRLSIHAPPLSHLGYMLTTLSIALNASGKRMLDRVR